MNERRSARTKNRPWWYRALCDTVWLGTPRCAWRRLAKSRRWLFVTGVNRSGKTTLSNLFRDHPLVNVVPNASNVSDALPNSISERCPHVWTEKLDRFRLTQVDAARIDPSRLLFDWLSFVPRLRPLMVIEADLVAAQMRWLQEILPDSFFVGMVRNGYAVAEGIRLKEGYPIERCARQWAIANRVMLDDAEYVRNFKLLRYEEFAHDPSARAREITRWIGLDPGPLEPALASGWPLQNTDLVPSKIRNANGELLARLSPGEIVQITAQAEDLLQRLRYMEDSPFAKDVSTGSLSGRRGSP